MNFDSDASTWPAVPRHRELHRGRLVDSLKTMEVRRTAMGDEHRPFRREHGCTGPIEKRLRDAGDPEHGGTVPDNQPVGRTAFNPLPRRAATHHLFDGDHRMLLFGAPVHPLQYL